MSFKKRNKREETDMFFPIRYYFKAYVIQAQGQENICESEQGWRRVVSQASCVTRLSRSLVHSQTSPQQHSLSSCLTERERQYNLESSYVVTNIRGSVYYSINFVCV